MATPLEQPTRSTTAAALGTPMGTAMAATVATGGRSHEPIATPPVDGPIRIATTAGIGVDVVGRG